MQFGFYFDQTRCIACNTCVVACRDWNELNPGPVKYRTVTVTEDGNYPNTAVYNLSIACNHCKNPACIPSCASNAISKRADGIVIIDKTKCTGLLQCVSACPYSQPQVADDKQEMVMGANWQIKHPAQKCTFCWDRVADGLQPVCVAACPARALDCGDLDALKAKYPDAVAANSNTVKGMPIDTKNTEPSLLVKVKGQSPKIVNPNQDI